MNKHLNVKQTLVTFIILILIRISIAILNNVFNTYILAFGVNQQTISLVLNSIIIIIFMIILSYYIKNILKYIIIFLITVYLLFALLLGFAEVSDTKYFYFVSPNSTSALVAEESVFLHGGWVNFYERKGLIFIKDLKTRINTDDAFRPFSTNRYSLNCLDTNNIDLYYDFGSGDYRYKKIVLK